MRRSRPDVTPREIFQEIGYLFSFVFYILASFVKTLPPATGGHKRPVVMLAGFLSPPLLWKKMAKKLRAEGHPVYAPDLKLQTGSAAQNAALLEQYLKRHNIRDAFLLAHSLAGLIAASLSPKARKRFRKIYLMGVPMKGTWLALLFPCLPLVLQGIPGSKYLKKLCKTFQKDSTVQCIYPAADDIILPNSSSRLNRQDDLLYPHFGHLHMIMSREGVNFIAGVLENEERALTRAMKANQSKIA